MSRSINGHTVYGKAIVLEAETEEEARTVAAQLSSKQVWEVSQLSASTFEVYVAHPEDCFAEND